jgi:hypothetical protein
MEIKELLESDEFKEALKKAVVKAVDHELENGVDAENINDLEGRVEEILNSGTFEVTFTT